MNLQTLSTSEFLRYAHVQFDELTSSDIEREALRRLEATDTDAFEAVTELGCTSEELHALNDAIGDYDIAEAVELLSLAKNFRELANDAGDLFSRLHTLTEATQEE